MAALSSNKFLRGFFPLLGVLLLLFVVLFPSSWTFRVISPAICPGAVYQYDLEDKIVALTIDDGPQPTTKQDSTAKILDVLRKYQAQATFFVISDPIQSREAEQLALDSVVQRMLLEGHELGNHLTRDEPSINLGDRFEPELLQAQSVITRYTDGGATQWLRPGGGLCTGRMQKIAEQNNYTLALGSLFPYDTVHPWPWFSDWFITNPINLKPGRIIVLHDGGDRGDQTVATLEKILPKLQNKGYQVVTLSQLQKDAREPFPQRLPLQSVINGIREPLMLRIPPESLIFLFWCVLSALMLKIGFNRGFLQWEFLAELNRRQASQRRYRPFLRQALRIFVMPALVEELLFRGIFQRQAIALFLDSLSLKIGVSFLIGVLGFVAYHPLLIGPLMDRLMHQSGADSAWFRGRCATTFRHPTFLVLASLLGLGSTVMYLVTESIWYGVLFHWIVVLCWISFLGGERKLRG